VGNEVPQSPGCLYRGDAASQVGVPPEPGDYGLLCSSAGLEGVWHVFKTGCQEGGCTVEVSHG